MTKVTRYTDEQIDAKVQQLRAQGVRYALGAYVDIHGVPESEVRSQSTHFADMARGSELFTGYALDGLGQEPNDDEISSIPDLDRGFQIPVEERDRLVPVGQLFSQ